MHSTRQSHRADGSPTCATYRHNVSVRDKQAHRAIYYALCKSVARSLFGAKHVTNFRCYGEMKCVLTALERKNIARKYLDTSGTTFNLSASVASSCPGQIASLHFEAGRSEVRGKVLDQCSPGGPHSQVESSSIYPELPS